MRTQGQGRRSSWKGARTALAFALALGSWAVAPPRLPACDAMMSAEYQEPPEWVELGLDRAQWDVGYRARLQLFARKEFVRHTETLRDWTELVTWNATFNPNRPALKEAQDGFLASMRGECPSLQSREIRASKNERIFEWWHTGCLNRPAQHEITRLIAGDIAMHTVSYSRKAASLPDADRERWIQWISGLKIGQRIAMKGSLSRFDQAQVAVWKGDYEGAIALLKPLADSGAAEAQELYARLFVDGWGLQQDYAQARQWFEKAAEKNAQAAYNLGRLYENGWGVERDMKAAARWYRSAAERGDPEGRARLAFMLATGADIERDRAASYHWFEQAAAQGHGHARYWLGKLSAEGVAGEPDLAKARTFYEESAREGEPEAQYELGVLCAGEQAKGCGIADAQKWLMRATMQGHEGARTFYLEHWGSPPRVEPSTPPVG